MMRVNGINLEAVKTLRSVLPKHWSALVALGVATGFRIGDLLSMRRNQAGKRKLCLVERKTGKHRAVYVPAAIRRQLVSISGKTWVFENKTTGKPYSRQAAWKAIKRAQRPKRRGAVLWHPHPQKGVCAQYLASDA